MKKLEGITLAMEKAGELNCLNRLHDLVQASEQRSQDLREPAPAAHTSTVPQSLAG